MDKFLEKFLFEGKLAVCLGPLEPHPKFKYLEGPDLSNVNPEGIEAFFGPAPRSADNTGNLKSNVVGTKFLWVDIDSLNKPLATLPATMTVFSGHGWHLYWELSEPQYDIELIERLNKIMIDDVPSADKACWNVNRFLRVPGSTNKKDVDDPIFVKLQGVSTPPYIYTLDDILMLEKLDKPTKHKIRTGDSRGYRSRSERDWAVITALYRAGASDTLIELLYQTQPVGVKYHEDNGKKYFDTTLQKAKTRATTATTTARGFEETSEGILRHTGRGPKRVSTFLIKPQLLLDGSAFGFEDAIVADVEASGYRWPGITFTRSAFTSNAKMDRETPMAAWQWLGRDDDVRALLPWLMEKLQLKGLPKVAATSTLGLHLVKDSYYFLGSTDTLGADDYWKGFEGPVAWLPSKKEHPELDLLPMCTRDELDLIAQRLPTLNASGSIWPMIGWYFATPFKTWFEANGYRFPVLNVVGTKGSGKTTLIQRVFMPLLGQIDPKSYDAGTTRFVTLALLGSSNGVPIAFSEFRFDSVEKFIRYILLAYDTGHDPRGRGDQTTVDYPLSAPFTVDGEDLVEDPAARERVVVARLSPDTIQEGNTSYNAYLEFRSMIPKNFGGHFIQRGLQFLKTGAMLKLLTQAREAMFETFPSKLPDRVRNNHIVAYTGVLLWCNVVNTSAPDPDVMTKSIESVFDIKAGRAKTMSDYLVEDIVNASSNGTQSFKWHYDREEGVLWFQLSSAHSWWMASRRRQGRSALERDSMKAQILETSYSRPPRVIQNTWMYGVHLKEAQDAGLDIPSVMETREFTFKF